MAATRGRFLTTSMRKWDHQPLKPGEIGELHRKDGREGAVFGRNRDQAAWRAGGATSNATVPKVTVVFFVAPTPPPCMGVTL